MKYQIETDDKQEFYMAYHGDDCYFALWDLDQWLRDEIKYNDKNDLQPVRDTLNKIMQDHNIDFENVT